MSSPKSPADSSKPTFSRLAGGIRLGRGYYRRHGWEASPREHGEPRGVVDALGDLGQPELDIQRVHPNVRRFFEDTSGLELFIESHWRGPFLVLWWLMRPLMAWFGQFVLPWREAHILTRCFALDTEADGRADARGIERYYVETGQTFQVAAYATWEHAGIHYMHASFPMPFGQIAGLLRMAPLESDARGRVGVVLTSERRADHPEDRARVWALLGRVAVPSPFGERLSLWAPGAPDCPVPASARCPDASVLGSHEQSLFGLRFVRHYYWFRALPSLVEATSEAPASEAPSSEPRRVSG